LAEGVQAAENTAAGEKSGEIAGRERGYGQHQGGFLQDAALAASQGISDPFSTGSQLQ
jgi:hypothetical protein